MRKIFRQDSFANYIELWKEETPFDIFCIKKYLDFIDISKKDIQKSSEECIKILGNKKDIDYSKTNEKGQNALFFACQGRSKELLKFLVEKKSNVDCVDSKGNTFLFKTIKHYRSVEVLLYSLSIAHDKINHLNKKGESVVSFVCRSHQEDRDFLMNVIMNKETIIPNDILCREDKKYETLKRMIAVGGGMTIESVVTSYHIKKKDFISIDPLLVPIILTKIYADFDKIFIHRKGEYKRKLDNVLEDIIKDVDEALEKINQIPEKISRETIESSIHCNHTAMVLYLSSKKGFDLNYVDKSNKENILFSAIEYSGPLMLKTLINLVGKINHVNDRRESILHKACYSQRRDSHELVKVLMDSKIDLFIEDIDGKTAIDIAIENNSKTENVFLLLYEDERVSRNKDSKGRSVFERCLIHKKESLAILAILQATKKSQNHFNSIYNEFLFHSIAHKSQGTTEILLSLNESPMFDSPMINKTFLNGSYKGNESTIFQLICMQKDPFFPIETIKYMIKLSANINLPIKNHNNSTVLHWAVKNNNIGLVRCLLENKADIGAVDDNNRTALEWCVIDDEWKKRTDIFNTVVIYLTTRGEEKPKTTGLRETNKERFKTQL